MKAALKLLAVGTTLAVASLSAQAQDNFVGLSWGETSSNIQRSSALKTVPRTNRLDHVINNSSTWGIRGGQQNSNSRYYLNYENLSDSYAKRYKFRQQNLLASYDMLLPVGDQTNLFGGVSAGLVKLEQDSRGFRRDTDTGVAAGLQVGVLQRFGANVSGEAGYRYIRTTADANLRSHDRSINGSLDLRSSEQVYLGLNYHF